MVGKDERTATYFYKQNAPEPTGQESQMTLTDVIWKALRMV